MINSNKDMRTELRIKRDNIIKKAWKDNKRHTTRPDFIEIFTAPVSIPSLYRILDNKIINAHISQTKVIERAIKK